MKLHRNYWAGCSAYVGARLSEVPLVHEVRDLLWRQYRVSIEHDWTAHVDARGNPEALPAHAVDMIDACQQADLAVFLWTNGEDSPQRGLHVELGAALAGGAKILFWCPPEHAAGVDLAGPRGLAFYAHPQVTMTVCPRTEIAAAITSWLEAL